jgi:hypothetical protein
MNCRSLADVTIDSQTLYANGPAKSTDFPPIDSSDCAE